MIFPLAAPALIVVLDGTVMHSYNQPFLRNGRVIAPLDPFVTAVAGRIARNGAVLVVTRGDRFAQITLRRAASLAQLTQTYVELAPVLRSLGVTVDYDQQEGRLEIQTARTQLVAPTPFNPGLPEAPAHEVFTPSPTATPRPEVSGSPAPRRTPLPIPCCTR